MSLRVAAKETTRCTRAQQVRAAGMDLEPERTWK